MSDDGTVTVKCPLGCGKIMDEAYERRLQHILGGHGRALGGVLVTRQLGGDMTWLVPETGARKNRLRSAFGKAFRALQGLRKECGEVEALMKGWKTGAGASASARAQRLAGGGGGDDAANGDGGDEDEDEDDDE